LLLPLTGTSGGLKKGFTSARDRGGKRRGKTLVNEKGGTLPWNAKKERARIYSVLT